MRKVYRKKPGKNVCHMCHYWKYGHGPRWTERDLERLREWDHEKRRYEKEQWDGEGA